MTALSVRFRPILVEQREFDFAVNHAFNDRLSFECRVCRSKWRCLCLSVIR